MLSCDLIYTVYGCDEVPQKCHCRFVHVRVDDSSVTLENPRVHKNKMSEYVSFNHQQPLTSVWQIMRWKAFPTINLAGVAVKTSNIMDMTPLDRSYVMCTVLSFGHLSDHVKLVWSHLSCHCFSILLLRAHQFCSALRALFWGCWQALDSF